MPVHSIVVATPNSAQRSRLVRIVDGHPDFRVIACTRDLMNTYNEVEERLPKAVLIADALADLPEFEVMHALFSELDIRWLVVKASMATSRLAAPVYRMRGSGADLFTIAADAPEDTILHQLLSLTRTASSRVPAAEKCGQASRSVEVRPTDMADCARQPVSRPSSQERRTWSSSTGSGPVILIGASTGGVDALLNVLSHFPVDCPPTLIVQHTGTGFGESLVGLLDRQCQARVELATEARPMQQGVITVGAGARRHLVIQDCRVRICGLDDDIPVSGHVPSVDRLFKSAVPLAPKIAAALLTGMGRDGAEGLRALRDAGAFTIAQDQASSVVYGMPRAAAEVGAAMKVLPLDRIGPALLQAAKAPMQTSREMLR